MSKLTIAERNAVTLFSGRILGTFLSIIYIIVTPRILGPEYYGYYSFWFSQLFLLFILFDLGTLDTIKRYLPYHMLVDTGKGRRLFSLMIAAKLLMIPIFFPLIYFYQNKLSYLAILLAAVMAALSFALSEISFAGNYMLSYTLQQSLRKLVRFLLLILLFVLFGYKGIIPSLVITEITVLLLIFLWVLPYIPKGPSEPTDKPFIEYMHYGFFIFLSTVIFLSMGRLPIIIAKLKGLTMTDIGYLALTIDICYFAMRELFYSITESILPLQTLDHAKGDYVRLLKSFRIAKNLTIVLIIPCTAILMVYADYLLILFGNKYAPVIPIFKSFLPIVAITVLAFIYRQILILYEEKGKILASNIIALALFLLLVLVPKQILTTTLTKALLISTLLGLGLLHFFSRSCLKIENDYSDYLKFTIISLFYYGVLLSSRDTTAPLQVVLVLSITIAYLALIQLFGLFDFRTLTKVLFSNRKVP